MSDTSPDKLSTKRGRPKKSDISRTITISVRVSELELKSLKDQVALLSPPKDWSDFLRDKILN